MEPVPAPSPKTSHQRIFIGIIALLIIILIALGYIYRTILAEDLNALLLPQELRGTLFFSKVSGKAYTDAGFSYKEALPDSSRIFAALQKKGVRAYITFADNQYAIVVNGKTYEASPTVKGSLALSGDGNNLAYVEKVTTASTTGQWQVVLLPLDTGARKIIGTGFAPLFFGTTTLSRLNSEGVVVTDLTTGKDTLALKTPVFKKIIMPIQSPTGRYFGWKDADSKFFFIYEWLGTRPFLFKQVAAVPIDAGVTGFALSNTALYTSFYEKNGAMTIMRATLSHASSTPVYTLPASLHITDFNL